MNTTTKRVCETDNDLVTITPHELADMLDSGLSPVVIDRLSFTRWRMREQLTERQASLHGSTTNSKRTKRAPLRATSTRQV